MSEVISEQDAAARKEQDVATIREQGLREDAAGVWLAPEVTFANTAAAANWLNSDPPTGPGEVEATVLDNGRVALIWYLSPDAFL